ncbi:hypothetical protein DQT32_03395 [Salmonella enterica subsp. enterica serovar Braenderup]|nr:hypothetical protein [Salmonella enterica subsp. enterica serovar Braenderup]
MLKIVFDAVGGMSLPDGLVLKYVDEEVLPLMLKDDFKYTICIGQAMMLDAIRVKIKNGVDISKVQLFVLKDGEQIPVPIYQNGRIGDWSLFPEVYNDILYELCQ